MTSPSVPSSTPPSAVGRRAVLGAAAAAPVLAGLSGTASAAPAARRRPPRLKGGGDLGPNVIVFDPSTPGIQATLDEAFARQEKDQFGPGRYQFFFKPGTYQGLNAQLGFCTSVSGLGLSPDDTTIHGDVTVDAGWFDGNATQNFWRSAENLALVPANGTNRWAVAQAAPFRRMHVRGDLNLASSTYGWASGGYIADSRIDGTVGPYSQQQWYTRESAVGGWTNAVEHGVLRRRGRPAQSFPTLPTPRSTRRRSPARSPSCTSTGSGTASSCPRCGGTRAASPGAAARRAAPRCRWSASTSPGRATRRPPSTGRSSRACTCCSHPASTTSTSRSG